jgi:hypothetical protein
MMPPAEIVRLALRIGQDIRDVASVLGTPRAPIRLAMRSIRQMIATLERLHADLAERDRAGLTDATDIVPRIHAASRGLWDFRLWDVKSGGGVAAAVFLANCIDMAVHLDAGDPFPMPIERQEAMRIAVKTHGVADFSLAMFVDAYSELAARIDRTSVDRLVTAWVAQTGGGGRWSTMAAVWKERVGQSLSPDSIKHEMTKLRAARFKRLDGR